MTIDRPAPDEYAPFYAGYIASVSGNDVVSILEGQKRLFETLGRTLTDEAALHRYAPGKWSVKELLGHLADAERVFTYRLLRVSRGDETPLSGFEENAYVAAAGSDEIPLADLVGELVALRTATLHLVRGLRPDMLLRRGTANGNPVSTRALVYTVAGHVAHHLNVLSERYGVRVDPAG
jgi:hypothetical protein